MRFRVPSHAYVPGETPRHPEGSFDRLTETARSGMTPAALAASDAWRAGWQFLRQGYFWEAHELFEPVWMALLPNSRERAMVQGAIQLANAALKARMGRPRAVLRLCDLSERHLSAAGDAGAGAMGADGAWLVREIARLRAEANLSLAKVQNSAK